MHMNAEPTTALSPAERARWSRIGALAAVAMLLGYLETFVPIPLPGVKLGLANVAVLLALVQQDRFGAAWVALIKVLAAGLLYGNPLTLAYSAAGTALSLAVMLPLSLLPTLHVTMLSVLGALAHQTGQLLVAQVVLGTPLVWYSAPVLVIAGVVTGTLSGVVAARAAALLAQTPDAPRPQASARDTAGGDGDMQQAQDSTPTEGATGSTPDAEAPTEAPRLGSSGANASADLRHTLLPLVVYLLFVVCTFANDALPWLMGCLVVSVVACVTAQVRAQDVVRALRPLAAIALITFGAQWLTLGNPQSALRATTLSCLRLVALTASSVALVSWLGRPGLTQALRMLLMPFEKLGLRTAGPLLAFQTALAIVPQLMAGFADELPRGEGKDLRTRLDALPLLVARACRMATKPE